ncbi:hypothetical protein MRX96_043206 [Rhipicephalus microplus]
MRRNKEALTLLLVHNNGARAKEGYRETTATSARSLLPLAAEARFRPPVQLPSLRRSTRRTVQRGDRR